jgi:hypothetical protein
MAQGQRFQVLKVARGCARNFLESLAPVGPRLKFLAPKLDVHSAFACLVGLGTVSRSFAIGKDGVLEIVAQIARPS